MSLIKKDGLIVVKRKDGKIVYDSWNDGSDVLKDKNGYYIMQWDVIKEKDYKKYLPKSWKPTPYTEEDRSKPIKNRTKKSKTKKNKTKRKRII